MRWLASFSSAAVGSLCILMSVGLQLGCTKANPSYCDSETPCASGICDEEGIMGSLNSCRELDCASFIATCNDDLTAEITCDDEAKQFVSVDCAGFGCDGARQACNECRPGMVVCAEDGNSGMLTSCDGDGTIVSQRACPFGCQQDGPPACIDIDPSNGLEEDLDYIDNNPAAIAELVLADNYIVNSDGTILDDTGTEIPVDSRSLPQTGAKPIRVFRVRSLMITGTVTVEGPDEVVAFVSDGDIFINGTLFVRAGNIFDETSDPLPDCMGKDGPGDGSNRPGSGGGGFGTAGLPGGDTAGNPPTSGVGGQGGTAHGTDDLQPLVGGCGSMIPFDEINDPDQMDARGGGALQLVSRTKIEFGPLGQLGAIGDGGHGANIDAGGNIASGGGSGGALLVEAPVVLLDEAAFISANGGGGGGGCAQELGFAGRISTVAALGANCLTDPDSGDGGSGGALTNPTAGMSNLAMPDGSGGGGGGAVGRIRINNISGTLGDTSRISPAPTFGLLGSR